MKLEPHQFKAICLKLREICGISLPPGKEYLVERRLQDLLKETQSESFDSFIVKLNNQCSQSLLNKLICELTTNETSFFRDGHPFETFEREILPDLIKILIENKKTLSSSKMRILSAACSSGQEPYSLAILIMASDKSMPIR